ncbi:glycosyltransferase family 2 protein [Ornithinimicrobium cryptoxanthini]|uniref:Glycosyltransferase family 2 protein n=1 Tax=Ornithinimicrobium cryptoxanthini TaxID=2934161 RepID=A0ABY4YH86_9MICO|nr:glycosyltransferase family A protein [Ornithinimicrobium cryptoxanthini]USQ76117.1 glycosyltransferase family 2 protein [Ornithinimicrobium cryptoxanthini]
MADDRPAAKVRVSAILPVRDPGPGLGPALEAVRTSLSVQDELIVVDDGSTDGTDVVLRNTDLRGLPTTVLTGVGAGVGAARNLGLAQARGEMVWFVDWDDRWDPSIIGLLYAARVASGAPVVGCGADLVDARGRRLEMLGTVDRPTLLTGGQIGVAILDGRIRGYLWNKLFARDILGEAPFPAYQTRSDFAGSAELMARLPSVYLLPNILFHHVQRPGSVTTSQHPTLDTLRRSLHIGERVAEAARTHPDGRADEGTVHAALREFRYREWHLAVAGTAMRAPLDPATRSEWLRLALDGALLRHVPHLLRRDPVLAARAAVLATAGRHYPAVYWSVVRLRAGMRRLTDRGAPE